MTDDAYTAMLLVVDRSGSMESIRADMEGGITQMLRTQAEAPGRLTVDIVTFDDRPEWDAHFASADDVHVRIEPRGSTALFDALGSSIVRFGGYLAALPEGERPGSVQVVVVTDGEENSSREWTSERVQAAVGHQRDVYQWDFVFLGANQDAAFAASTVGIAADAALQYAPAAAGVAAASASLNRYVSGVRAKSRTGFTDTERSSAMGS